MENDQPACRTNQPKALSMDMVALNQKVTTILRDANATAVKGVGRVATLFVALGTLSAIMLPNPNVTQAVRAKTHSPPLHSRVRPFDKKPMTVFISPPNSSLPAKEIEI